MWAYVFIITLTSGEEPVGVLDDGLNHAYDLQGHRGHHLRHVSANKNGSDCFSGFKSSDVMLHCILAMERCISTGLGL